MPYDRTLDRRCRRVAETLGLPLNRNVDGLYRVGEITGLPLNATWERLDAVGAERRTTLLSETDIVPQGRLTLHVGDAQAMLRQMPGQSVQSVVTSPPYFQQLDYNHAQQIGQEALPEEYVARLMSVFDETRRVLRDDGVMWLLLGGSYVANPATSAIPRAFQGNGTGRYRIPAQHHADRRRGMPNSGTRLAQAGYPLKSWIDIPGIVAAALGQQGWIVRSPIIWEKSSSVPEPSRDRPRASHEVLLLVTRQRRYSFYPQDGEAGRSVWRYPPGRGRTGHPAPMPRGMVRRCIELSSRPGETVLDMFGGSGTTGQVDARRRLAGIIGTLVSWVRFGHGTAVIETPRNPLLAIGVDLTPDTVNVVIYREAGNSGSWTGRLSQPPFHDPDVAVPLPQHQADDWQDGSPRGMDIGGTPSFSPEVNGRHPSPRRPEEHRPGWRSPDPLLDPGLDDRPTTGDAAQPPALLGDRPREVTLDPADVQLRGTGDRPSSPRQFVECIAHTSGSPCLGEVVETQDRDFPSSHPNTANSICGILLVLLPIVNNNDVLVRFSFRF